MKRWLALACVAVFFAAGFTQCDPPPKFSCAHPTHLAGYHGTLQFSGQRYVQNNVWTEQGQQSMDVCAPSNWRANVTQSGAPETGVKTYPNSEQRFTDYQYCSSAPTLGSLSKLTGFARHAAPNVGSWNAAWDLFVNGAPCSAPRVEIMVWDQWFGLSVPAPTARPVIDGVSYDLYAHPSTGYFQFRRHTQTTAASVNLLAILRYMQGRGFLAGTDRVQFAQFGFEALTTYGKTEPFWLTGFSVSRS